MLKVYGWLIMLGSSLCCTPALSHTRLLESTPANGQVMTQAPAQIRLKFSTPVEVKFSQLELTRQGTNTWQVLKISGGKHIVTGYLPRLVPTTYHIRWRVLSADGHLQRGEFSFELR